MSHRRRRHSSDEDDSASSGDERRSSRERDSRRRHECDRDRDRDWNRDREWDRDRDRDRGHYRRSPGVEENRAVEPAPRPLSDWYCRCGALNFRRRNTCHRQNCSVTRAQATGLAAVGAGVTKRLALSGLDTASGEESVVRALQASAPAAAARLAGVLLGPQESGICYLTYPTITDAMDAYGALLAARLQINGCKISVAYQPEVWGDPSTQSAVQYGSALAPRPVGAFNSGAYPQMAAYNAQMYANSSRDRSQYSGYYNNYHAKQSGAPPTEADRVNAAAAVAQSAISQLQARGARAFTEDRIYPTPDTSIYVYDESSGYYYDPSTGLYYDPSTQYYYNSQSGQYLYWNAAKMTYTPASSATMVDTATAAATDAATTNPQTEQADSKKKNTEKPDKIKVAKRIAKDMERWAKTLNQKKDMARNVARAEASEAAAKMQSSGSADIGFSVLESRGRSAALPPTGSALVPTYGNGSESSGDEDDGIIDLNKMACLLCKRQFPSKEVLEKHLKLSDLHRQNLEEFKKNKKPSMTVDERSYRDRAAERRFKYGEDDPPPPIPRGKLPRAAESHTNTAVRELGSENVGNRLLQKMGWTAGQGLGREGQGRVDPLEAKSGPMGAGLGQKRGIYTAGPGETYQDCVKKLTIARYQDLMENEANS